MNNRLHNRMSGGCLRDKPCLVSADGLSCDCTCGEGCAAAKLAGWKEACYVMYSFWAESQTAYDKDMTQIKLMLLCWAWAA